MTAQTKSVATRRDGPRTVWAIGLIAAAIATVGSLFSYALATVVGVSFLMSFQPDTAPIQLPAGMVVATTIAGVVLATIVFAVLRRLGQRGLRAFQIAGVAFLLLSLGGPLGLNGADVPTKIALVLMHIVTGTSILLVFSRLGTSSPAAPAAERP